MRDSFTRLTGRLLKYRNSDELLEESDMMVASADDAELGESDTSRMARRSQLALGTDDMWAWEDDEQQRTPMQDIPDRHTAPSPHQLDIGSQTLERRQITTIACQAPLHTDKKRLVLNNHLYIATDSRTPRSDTALAPYFNIFPCAHVLDDFLDSVPQLKHIMSLRSKEEGVKLAKFLYPFLDAMIAARGVTVVGTHGSTFSNYVRCENASPLPLD